MEQYDAIVAGGGPTGLAAAALLARRGWRVAAFEKHPSRYALPRAGHVDHEVLRILQGVDAHQPVIDDTPDYEAYEWLNAAGETLLSFPFGEPSVSGFQSDHMLFQPVLDDALHASIERSETGEVALGAAVVGIEQDADGVTATIAAMARDDTGRTVPTGERRRVRAGWLLAADGAGSAIRDELLRIPRADRGFDEQWLAIDVRVKRPLPPSVNGQWCDPRRPIYIGPLGRRHHRFECAVLPGETVERMEAPETAWAILAEHGVTPDDVEIFRQVVYRFEARVAERWRDGRAFLLGDAAHTMPPFMGQGLCSGVRDAANLAWKLDLVLRGVADDALLDTYEQERRPHVQRWIELSVAVGKLSCILDPVEAAARDAAFREGRMPALPTPPQLTTGVLDLDTVGAPIPPAGELFVQAPVRAGDRTELLHDVVGHGFLLCGLGVDPRDALAAAELEVLERLGAVSVWIADDDPDALGDPTGRMTQWFRARVVVAALVRPDYVVAGASRTLGELPGLVRGLERRLGLRAAASSERAA